ncbi:NAD-dependent epimerase/dehydratase family protein [Flavobacteriaceae bacterium XHP0103]|uniref:NAD-dependent epimerase/dehydratase family protein n=1 Tax=Marixanthotalea marina TaxID=2844359 RepID=UPI002989BB5C|nr:NAD-dependent epimerase/dehydratase family protein [Marixanthotalea marina]MBU3822098.1 NAD-dependent epimerase/dehydratase family protein [Marixanthotalea marina]
MILVTGATGLVGSHLLFKLAKSNEKVRALYRDKEKLDAVRRVFSCYTDNYQPLFGSIEWFEGDILDIPSLSKALKDIKYVYHCAALVSFEPHKYHTLRKTNIEGTANVVNLSIANQIEKLCYVSSVATLGSPIKNEPVTEDTFWNPEEDNNVYAITKYGAEMEVWRATQEGLNAVIVNPSVILGAGIWDSGSGSLFKRAHKGLNFYTKGTINLVAVEDVVSIMIKLMESNITNQRYILVAKNWSYKQFLTTLTASVNAKAPKNLAKPWLLNTVWRLDWLLHKIIGKKRELTKHLSRSLNSHTVYSNAKIKSELDDVQFKSVEKTISEIGAIYLKQV